MGATRKQRLQETLRAELSEIIRRDMRDPRFRAGLLSITDVEASDDLKHAVVFVSILGDEAVRKTEMQALRDAKGVLKYELGKRKLFNFIPDLSFRYDDTLERGASMFALLERVRQEDEQRAKDAGIEPESLYAKTDESESGESESEADTSDE